MTLRRVTALVFALWALGTLAGLVCWRNASAQQVHIDTTSAQYHQRTAFVDSLVRGPVVRWVERLRFPDWRITIRADTLEAGVVARTYAREEYRQALIVFDLDQLDQVDFDEVLVHELLHIKLSGYTTLARALAQSHAIANELQRREEALVTDLMRSPWLRVRPERN